MVSRVSNRHDLSAGVPLTPHGGLCRTRGYGCPGAARFADVYKTHGTRNEMPISKVWAKERLSSLSACSGSRGRVVCLLERDGPVGHIGRIYPSLRIPWVPSVGSRSEISPENVDLIDIFTTKIRLHLSVNLSTGEHA